MSNHDVHVRRKTRLAPATETATRPNKRRKSPCNNSRDSQHDATQSYIRSPMSAMCAATYRAGSGSPRSSLLCHRVYDDSLDSLAHSLVSFTCCNVHSSVMSVIHIRASASACSTKQLQSHCKCMYYRAIASYISKRIISAHQQPPAVLKMTKTMC